MQPWPTKSVNRDAEIMMKKSIDNWAMLSARAASNQREGACACWSLSIRAMIGSDGLAKGDGATSIDHGFDPMSVLIEDAVAAEPTELFYDFIDRLMTPQLPPPALGSPSLPTAHIPHPHPDQNRPRRVRCLHASACRYVSASPLTSCAQRYLRRQYRSPV